MNQGTKSCFTKNMHHQTRFFNPLSCADPESFATECWLGSFAFSGIQTIIATKPNIFVIFQGGGGGGGSAPPVPPLDPPMFIADS